MIKKAKDIKYLTDDEYELLDAEETENYLKEIEENEESKNN